MRRLVSVGWRRGLGCLTLLCSLSLIAACGSGTSGPASGSSQASPGSSTAAAPSVGGWQQVLEGARREGTVTVYTGVAGSSRWLTDAFEKAYPGVKVSLISVPTNGAISRITAERAAGKYLPDIVIGGGTTTVGSLKPLGALAPVKPALVLPEVADESHWLDGHLWWVDLSEPLTTLAFQGEVQPVVSYNTKLVDGKELTSYWNLVEPKWKGKIIGRDVRTPGPGGSQIPVLYKNPQLGPPFLERMYGDMNMTLSVDGRQMIDWLAQGRFSIGFVVNSRELGEAARQGLPVANVPAEQFQEGATIGQSGGSLSLIDRGPHPQAAQVFINWLLSKEGQTAWQSGTQTPTLRLDVPKDGIDPVLVPKPGVHYTNGGTEEYERVRSTELTALITKALDKAQAGS